MPMMTHLLLPLALSLTAPGAGPERPTITALVARSGGDFDRNHRDFDILLTAVQTAGLAGALDDADADLTLFAPNDAAFIRLANSLGFEGSTEAGAWTFLVGALTDLGNGDPIPVLTQVLLYHVAPESLTLPEIRRIGRDDGTITTLQGGVITPDRTRLRDAEPDLRDPRITGPVNVRAGNGIIHAIDRVLLPVNLP
jgi:serralysin